MSVFKRFPCAYARSLGVIAQSYYANGHAVVISHFHQLKCIQKSLAVIVYFYFVSISKLKGLSHNKTKAMVTEVLVKITYINASYLII